MKTAGKVLLIFLFTVLCVWNWTYPGYCKEKTRKEHYPDGKLKAVYPENDGGLLDGVVKKYYQSGKLQGEETYMNNFKEGTSKWYYENGKLKEAVNYKSGKRDGIGKAYYESGKVQAEVNFKDGKQDGRAKAYYESGKVMQEENYKDGNLISHTCYDEKGNPIECPKQ